jgi:UDP-N-acetylglucosamine diphosphorylase / glucose-1-phosphate thymidylyltransferase / UDP-N-acetylgalactosamine diphosphorylase / glucosamine-1-phosphate N-acetyltransferase / galactosamine-1-phosphate N-acetyltransferase
MQAVILAAGKGTRMGGLTKDRPKPMLLYRGKNLIEHKLDALPSQVKEVIIVVGYLGSAIREHFGDSYKGLPIRYVEQKELLGTAHCVWQAKGHIKERFMVLNGDDLYGREDLEALAREERAILANRDATPMQKKGKLLLNADGSLRDIVEDFEGTLDSPLINTGACVMTPDIFSYEPAQIPGKKEYGLPQTIVQMLGRREIRIVEATYWKQITSPEDLL